MGDLSLHFDRSEFACRGEKCCGHAAPVCDRLVRALELLRLNVIMAYKVPGIKFHINSGFRCPVHNQEVGGDPRSYHMFGMAADVRPEGVTPLQVAAMVKTVPDLASGGVGVYPEFVHLDVRRNGPARW